MTPVSPVPEAERAAWADLAARYRWLYGMSLQQRLAEQGPDVNRWWLIGGRADAPPTPRKAPGGGPAFEALPEKVRDILTAVSLETGISVSRILAGQLTRSVTRARSEAIRRLHALPWAYTYGQRPSSTQIGYWLGVDHTTVLRVLKPRSSVDG